MSELSDMDDNRAVIHYTLKEDEDEQRTRIKFDIKSQLQKGSTLKEIQERERENLNQQDMALRMRGISNDDSDEDERLYRFKSIMKEVKSEMGIKSLKSSSRNSLLQTVESKFFERQNLSSQIISLDEDEIKEVKSEDSQSSKFREKF